MKTLVETSVTVDDGVTRVGPGSRLRLAREQANISVDAIAARLHLRSEIISSIEADDYANAPSFVFIKGYIRAYAKILGLNGNELIDMFNGLGLEEADSKRTVRQFRRPPEWENQHRQWRWGALLTLFSVAVMVLIWWQANKSGTDDAVTATAMPDAPAVVNQAVSKPPEEIKVPVQTKRSVEAKPPVETKPQAEAKPPEEAEPPAEAFE